MLGNGFPAAALLSWCLLAQQKPAPGGVDQAAIHRAIDRGVAALKQMSAGRVDTELVLWTFQHAGIPETDPAFQNLLKTALENPIWKSSKEVTYNMCMLAMCLQNLDAARFQRVIAQVAQFLVDTQCQNGQWAYGESWTGPASFDVRALPAPSPKKEGKSTKSLARILVKPSGKGSESSGDNSNSQYAALGIRACHDAGIQFPEATLRLAKAWWEKDQDSDGSWNYGEGKSEKGYGSMTVGAIGGLAIYDDILRLDLRKDPAIAKGFAWLAKNFTVTSNPAHDSWPYYYLYGLERAGDLTATRTIGPHPWYPEGVRYLLGAQQGDGSWKGPDGEETTLRATCFSILFLKRATQSLPSVASVDDRAKAGEGTPKK